MPPAQTPATPHFPPGSALEQALSALSQTLVAILCASLLTLFNIYAYLLLPIPRSGSIAAHLTSIAYLAVLLFVLMRAASGAARLPVSIGSQLAVGLALSIPALVSILSSVAHPLEALAGIVDALPYAARFVISNLLTPLGMVLVGAGIGRIFRHPNTLLAGAGFAIFFDAVMVTMGTVAQVMKSGSNIISVVSVGAASSAAVGPVSTHGHAIPSLSGVTIGPADVLFIAVFLAAVRALRLSNRATFAWMYLFLLSALVLVETTALPIPALVPMGIAVLIANGRFAAFTRTEKRDLAIGSAFALCCAGLIISLAHRFVPSARPHFGFRLSEGGHHELIVAQIEIGSPAFKGGLRPGDLVVTLAGVPARQFELLSADQVAERLSKSALNLQVRRPGVDHLIDVTLHSTTGP